MSINIKNEETHRLASQLAQITGESLTLAVTVAVEERISRLRRGGAGSVRAARMLAIGRACASRFDDATRAIDHGELLYGEDGLPK